MNSNETKLDSMTPTFTTKSAKPDIEFIAKIKAGQKIGIPNVINSQQKKPDFTPPTFKSK